MYTHTLSLISMAVNSAHKATQEVGVYSARASLFAAPFVKIASQSSRAMLNQMHCSGHAGLHPSCKVITCKYMLPPVSKYVACFSTSKRANGNTCGLPRCETGCLFIPTTNISICRTLQQLVQLPRRALYFARKIKIKRVLNTPAYRNVSEAKTKNNAKKGRMFRIKTCRRVVSIKTQSGGSARTNKPEGFPFPKSPAQPSPARPPCVNATWEERNLGKLTKTYVRSP